MNYKSEIFVLLVAGIIVFALGICVMVPFCYSAIKNENILWNKVRKHAYKYFEKLYQPCIERLSSIHFQGAIAANYGYQVKNDDQNIMNYWKYIWRICLFLIATSVFSMLNITVFYERLENYLYLRPMFIESLLNAEILLTNLDVWTSEVALTATQYSLEAQTAYPNSFSSIYTNFKDTVSLINWSSKELRDPKYSPISSASFKTHFYEEDFGSERPEHRLGSYEASEYSIIEAEFISHIDGQYANDWISLVKELQNLDLDYDELINYADIYSQNVIDQQMSTIIATLIIFIIGSLVVYFCFYLTFFIKEKKYLKRISSMLEIIPE